MNLGKRTPNKSGRRLYPIGDPLEPLEPRTLMSFSLSDTGPTILNRDDGITSSVAFDWDADGKQDLLVASGREVLFLKGDGLGRFQPPRSLVRLSNPIGLLALDPDSTPQRFSLFAAQIGSSLESTGNLRELVPDGSGGLRVRAATIISQIVSITPIRVTADQPVDLLVHTRQNTAVFGTLDSFDKLIVLRRSPAGRFVPASDLLLSNITTSRFSTPGVFDLDGDGKTEIVVSGFGTANSIRFGMSRVRVDRTLALSAARRRALRPRLPPARQGRGHRRTALKHHRSGKRQLVALTGRGPITPEQLQARTNFGPARISTLNVDGTTRQGVGGDRDLQR